MDTSPARGVLHPLALAAALALVAVSAGCGGSAPGEDGGAVSAAPPASPALAAPASRGPSVLRSPVTLIDGRTLRASALRGKVVMVVNTASRCGYTPQFEGLEALYRARRGRGLVVVGFPSDDFRQELEGNGEIAKFCTLNYGVSFPMAARSRVTGRAPNPLFAAIAARPGPAGEEPAWNFTKYLLDRSGRLVARYPSSVEPGDPVLRAAVDRLLDERGV